jgi:hypothetical protein
VQKLDLLMRRQCPMLAEAVEELFSGFRDATMIREPPDFRNRDSYDPTFWFFYFPTDALMGVLQQSRL